MKARMFFAAVTLAALPTATATQAQSVGEQTGVNSALGVAPSTADFVSQAAISDHYESAAGEAALAANVDQPTKDFAQHMIEAHRKTSEELKALVAGGVKAEVPSKMDASHAEDVDELKQKQSADFAGEYVDDQVEAHETAVSLFERYAKGGEDSKLKEWAGKTLPELRKHLEMARALDK